MVRVDGPPQEKALQSYWYSKAPRYSGHLFPSFEPRVSSFELSRLIRPGAQLRKWP